ncbi:MAG: CoA-transferase [Acidobacteriota bacterium]|jgi:propionate CoA-transferase|nr:CoA-transferase [Acidobacteriota bacterium]
MIETEMADVTKSGGTKIISAEEAAALIQDGVTICAPIMGLAGWPEEIARAIAKRYEETKHPKDLTLVCGSAMGNHKDKGPHVIGIEGLVTRFIGAHTHGSPNIGALIQNNKMLAYCFPQGVVVHMYREIAAKRFGVMTKIGLGTFVDPRIEGGKMNELTRNAPDLNEVVTFNGEEYLWYKPFPIHVGLIRGTKADERGNISMEKEGAFLEALPVAQAAKNSGGIVIAQVEYVTKAGTLHPKSIQVPGVMVDHIVVAKNPQEFHMQSEGVYYHPAFSGDVVMPLGALPELPFDERLFILRRAAMELEADSVVNLGIGIPDRMATLTGHEGVSHMMTLTTEAGAVGGVPAGWPNFGMTYNPETFIMHPNMFDWYDGGGIDQTFLGMGEIDSSGNVNVSKFGGRPIGCGGFINITTTAKRVAFCGTFTTGGLKTTAENGKLKILQEGSRKKFLNTVEQITFSGKYAANGRTILYITERAVFQLIDGKMTLIEIAPGIDLEKDILPQMEFKPEISPNLRPMPEHLFREEWGRLKGIIEAKKQK